jgi:hypothetical protein
MMRRMRATRRLVLLLPAFFLLAGCARILIVPEAPPVPDTIMSLEIASVWTSAAPAVLHVPLPQEVRGIYWTAVTAGSDRGRDALLAFMEVEGLNTVVVDLKMDDGELAFEPQDESLKAYAMENPSIADLDAVLAELAEREVYRIARIPVMRDGAFATLHPELALRRAGGALWRDSIGSVWLDPAAPAVTDYTVALAREASARGFDEVQFDYVRFPSDGAVSAIVYPVYNVTRPKEEVMATVFAALGEAMRESDIPLSFDVFGMTLWSTDDFNIGQRLVDAYAFADFVSPMVYPSHYPNGFQGYGNPARFPYEIVNESLEKGVAMLQIELNVSETDARRLFRPWLQAFDIGAVYDAPMLQAQIKAARDAGASGWIFWNARNVYGPVLLADM